MLKTQGNLSIQDIDGMHDGLSGIPSIHKTCPVTEHVTLELLDIVYLAVTDQMSFLDSIEEAQCLAAWFPEGAYLGD